MSDITSIGKRNNEEFFLHLKKEKILNKPDLKTVKKEEIFTINKEPLIRRLSSTKEYGKKYYRDTNFLPRKQPRFVLSPSDFSWSSVPALAVFVLLSLVLVSAFPLLQMAEKERQAKSAVLGAATSAYDEFLGAQQAVLDSNYDGANFSLSSAYQGFDKALDGLQDLSVAVSLLPQVETGKQVLSAARDSVLGAQYLLAGLTNLLELKAGSNGLYTVTGAGLEDKLKETVNNLNFSSLYLTSASGLLDGLDMSSVPLEFKNKIEIAKEQISVFSKSLGEILSLQSLISDFASAEEKKYLVLFQNYRELRATGGFIGTVGLLTLKEGQIKDLKIETVYNSDGQLKLHVAPPGPLQRHLTDRWGLRDSNWFFDFPTSAEKATEFYELETGVSVDGVMAFTPEIFKKLLEITGPITMSGYGEVLTGENFVDVVQYQTSEIYDRELNQPKKFLADFTPVLLNWLGDLSNVEWLNVFEVLLDSLSQKNTLLFSFDDGQQERFENMGWAGQVRTAPHDYLAVVNSNVGAGKTDQNISQEINLESKLLPDGSILNKLIITRTHMPGNEKEFPTNVDFMRIFVPARSRLISVFGFENYEFLPASLEGATNDPDLKKIDNDTLINAESNTLIYKESGKTVFANWLVLAPGETKQVKVEYIVPVEYNLSESSYKAYSILVQKQPGAPDTKFSGEFVLPRYLEVWSVYPQNTQMFENKLIFDSDFQTDEVWGLVFK